MKKLFLFILPFAAAFFTACTPETVIDETELPAKEAKRILILSEGFYGDNSASLAHYDFDKQVLTKDYFTSVNQRGLGDTANDAIRYGAKIYVVVNSSSTVEVIAANTGKSLKQIPMKTAGNQAKQPRYAAAYGGKVYVTSHDDTVTRIDTTTLSIDGSVQVGPDPEGICIANNNIYVANSGGMNFPNYDKTVSVIDLKSFTETKKIEVGLNPKRVYADKEGDVYVYSVGNYTTVPATFQKITPKDEVAAFDEVKNIMDFTLSGDKAFIYYKDYATSETVVSVFDCLNDKLLTGKLIADKSIAIPYSITVDPFSGDIYLTDAVEYVKILGNVYCYDKTGKRKFTLENPGYLPNRVLFLN